MPLENTWYDGCGHGDQLIVSAVINDSASLCSDDIFNTLRPRQNGHHFPDDISKCIFLHKNARISIKI